MDFKEKQELATAISEAIADSQWQLETARQQAALRLVVAQNVTANGRMFSALLVLVNLATRQPGLALAAALPVGLSVITDLIPFVHARARLSGSIGVYSLAALVAVLSLLNAW